jgi:hypothetical protein
MRYILQPLLLRSGGYFFMNEEDLMKALLMFASIASKNAEKEGKGEGKEETDDDCMCFAPDEDGNRPVVVIRFFDDRKKKK